MFDSIKESLDKVYTRLAEDRRMLQKEGLLAQENFLVIKHACCLRLFEINLK
jgi:hypothetical protein